MTAPAQMHALLDSSCTSLVWDARTEPKCLTVSNKASQMYGPNALSFPLTSTGAGHIRIYSEQFPWCVEIGPKMRAITAAEALRAIFELLCKDLDETVWGIADDGLKVSIERAWARRKKIDPVTNLKNVDWLGKHVIFGGLYRDDAFVQRRTRPGTQPISETWLIAFTKA